MESKLIGKKIHRLTVIKKNESRKDCFDCICDCGNTVTVHGSSLRKKPPIKSCGCLAAERESKLIGKKHYRLTVIKKNESKEDYFDCICDCGNTVTINGSSLRKKPSPTKSCGCLRAERIRDLTGKKFGKLTVLKKSDVKKRGRNMWDCICDCGNKATVLGANLEKGVTKSCGCLSKVPHEHMLGKKFGRLTVVRMSNIKKYGYTAWECICECGNETIVSGTILRQGDTLSCGCLRTEACQRGIVKARTKLDSTRVDGVLTAALDKKMLKNNKSGVKGVCFANKAQKWLAAIGINNKQIRLGAFDNFEDAVEARKKAEEKYFKPFLDKRKAEESQTARAKLDSTCVDGVRTAALDKKVPKNNKSGIKGVCFLNSTQKWLATIGINNKQIRLGAFNNIEDAAEARKKAEEKYFKPFLDKRETEKSQTHE
ncbi:MAG: AP2 domain-containing protein [Defluviitaleaceae bacterium]|nr:AP2 domain-containing protein [Defluviitaleaceae bacterium]